MLEITFLAHRVPSLADFGMVQGFVGNNLGRHHK